MVNLKFHLKQGYAVEAYNCNDEDITKVRSQFNNGNLIVVKNLCINPQELVYFSIYVAERAL